MVTALDFTVLAFGILASILVICSFVPLSYRIIKTRSTHGLSAIFSLLMVVCGFVWVAYAIYILAITPNTIDAIPVTIPILVTNSIGIICHSINLIIKYFMVLGAKKNHMSEKQYCDLVLNKKQQK